MKYLLNTVIVLAVLGIGAILFVWSGFYNIAATQPHWAITSSLVETLRDRSIIVRSETVRVPKIDALKVNETAFSHYHEMCRFCHGAPGYGHEEFVQGLYPVPPSMTAGSIQKKRSESDIYWIVKHGIKMTGMPAFGPTHGEEELWNLVAFAGKLSGMDKKQYHLLVEKQDDAEQGHGHKEAEMH